MSKTKEFVNDVNIFNQTPLIIAAKNGFDEVFSTLINIEEIQINAQDNNGIPFFVFYRTAFLNALLKCPSFYSNESKNYQNIINSLLSHKDNDINITDDELILNK